ncbi:hypothetical protein VNO77_25919 [Canavalia gladiata]|uniref:Uncharacterized protein n=1 Tax=Canavalia gladiata TaxID=3824 RepID=A0AAN9Q5W2_CANGL
MLKNIRGGQQAKQKGIKIFIGLSFGQDCTQTLAFSGNPPLGYMVRVDSSRSMISTNQKMIEKYTRKKEHYLMNWEIKELIAYCEMNEIGLQIEVIVGPTAEVASNATIDFQATNLILVRQMHKDMKHFMYRLPCGMYRITSDNSIEKLKDPISTAITESLAGRYENVRCKEMFPGSEEEEHLLQRFKYDNMKYEFPIVSLDEW